MSEGEQWFWISAVLLGGGYWWARCVLQTLDLEWGAKHGKSRGCKTTKEVVEDRETTNLSAMVK